MLAWHAHAHRWAGSPVSAHRGGGNWDLGHVVVDCLYGGGGGGGGEELGREGLCWELDVVFAGLGGEKTFGLVTVSLTFAVLFVGVLYTDFLVHEVLPVHGFDGFVGGFEGVV